LWVVRWACIWPLRGVGYGDMLLVWLVYERGYHSCRGSCKSVMMMCGRCLLGEAVAGGQVMMTTTMTTMMMSISSAMEEWSDGDCCRLVWMMRVDSHRSCSSGRDHSHRSLEPSSVQWCLGLDYSFRLVNHLDHCFGECLHKRKDGRKRLV
jgi:hypothetical protein